MDSKEQKSVNETTYQVEEILQKRIIGGRPHYLLKWVGYPESSNSWEPIENLECTPLLREFEKTWKQLRQEERRNHIKIQKPNKKKYEKREYKPRRNGRPFGFARGLELERIVNMIYIFNDIIFMVKWKNLTVIDCIEYSEVKKAAPAKVLKYLQSLK